MTEFRENEQNYYCSHLTYLNTRGKRFFSKNQVMSILHPYGALPICKNWGRGVTNGL